MADCDDPRCPGWFVNEETDAIERCDTCQQFEDDIAAADHVRKLHQQELELKYRDYPKWVRIDGRKNMILCTRCGEYTEMFVGALPDFLSGVFQFMGFHQLCGEGPSLRLTENQWAELIAAVSSKAQNVRNGAYDGDGSDDYDPKKWADELDILYSTIAAELDKRGIPY